MRLRAQFGNFRDREFYGFVAGPLVDDVLAARLVATKLDRDCSLKGLGESNDINSIDGRNVALGLLWTASMPARLRSSHWPLTTAQSVRIC